MKMRGDAEVLLQVHEQIEDLRLNAHVERADRLVGDDEFRFAGKRRGDADALALPARKVGGQAVGQCRVEADAREEIEHASVAVGRRADTEAVERFPHAAADRPARIEAAIGILEHRLHAAAEIRERACRASPATSTPSKMMEPLSGLARPRMQRPSVLLPLPDSPTSPSVRPRSIRDRDVVERRDGFGGSRTCRPRRRSCRRSFDAQQLSHARPPSAASRSSSASRRLSTLHSGGMTGSRVPRGSASGTRGDQRARVGMRGRAEEVARLGGLEQPAAIHHADPVADHRDDAEIVGDQQDGRSRDRDAGGR